MNLKLIKIFPKWKGNNTFVDFLDFVGVRLIKKLVDRVFNDDPIDQNIYQSIEHDIRDGYK